jgi:hypothetical protein
MIRAWTRLALATSVAAAACGGVRTAVPSSDPRAIGTEGPINLIALAPDGSWIVIEQVRVDTNGDGRLNNDCSSSSNVEPRDYDRQDDQQQYLVFGAGPGTPIDDIYYADPTSSWLVVVRDSQYHLVNTKSRRWTVLPDAQEPDDRACELDATRQALFDESGRVLLYVKSAGGSSSAIVRTLSTGKQHSIALGSGSPRRIELSRGGSFVAAYFVKEKPGQHDDDRFLSNFGTDGFQCSVSPFFVLAGPDRERLEARVARAEDDAATPVAGFVSFLGDDYVARTPGGGLALHGRDGTTPLLPDGCDPRILARHDRLHLAVATCRAEQLESDRAALYLLGRDVHVQLGAGRVPRSLAPGEASRSLGGSESDGLTVSSRFERIADVWIDFHAHRIVDEHSLPADRSDDRPRSPVFDPPIRQRLVPAKAGECWDEGPLHWQ